LNLPPRLDAIICRLTPQRLLLVFCLLVLPAVFAPYHSDDYFQLLLLSENSSIQRNDASLWGLFSFIDEVPQHREQLLQYGVLPWFAADDFYFRFWRPISEITHWLDFKLFGINPLPAHIHSIAWFLLLSGIVYQLARRIFPDEKLLPMLALAIFILDGQHVATIGWIANRNSLVAAVFAFAALYSHIVWRETEKKRYFFIAIIVMGVALLSGEASLAIISYFFFYATILDGSGYKKGLVSVLPYFLLVGIWFYFYQNLGFGVNTSAGLYLNPFLDTAEYITAVIYRVPIYFTSALLPIPAGLSWGGGAEHAWLSVVFYGFALLVVTGFLVAFYKVVRNNKPVHFCFLSSIFALLPVCATMAQDRLALFETVGFDMVIAALILYFLQGKKPEKKYVKYCASALVVIHLILSPLHLWAGSIYMHLGATAIASNALSIKNPDLMQKQVICFQVPIGEAVSLMGIREVMGFDNPQGFFWLSNDEGELIVKVLSNHRIQVEKKLGFANGFESAFRSVKKQPFHPGQSIDTPFGMIEITNINQQGYPDRIEVHFDKPLTDTDLLFYTFKNGGYAMIELPDTSDSIKID
jgi:hypothetical protein